MNAIETELVAHFDRMKRKTLGFSVSYRIEKLRSLKNWINKHRSQIVHAVHQDLQKPASETLLTEIYTTLSEIKHAIRNLRYWSRAQLAFPTLTTFSAHSSYYYQPRGVVLIISPWNFPFNLSISPLISAIAAGNRIVLKPSSLSTATTSLLVQMSREIFSDEELFVVPLSGSVAGILGTLPFDHIHFIGSSDTGKVIMKQAANKLIPITLELGGRNIVIVAESADLQDAVSKIVWGKFMNNGQSCIAPNTLLIHRSLYTNAVAQLIRKLEKVYGNSPQKRFLNKDFGRIITVNRTETIASWMDMAKTNGAQVVFGGQQDIPNRYIEPTVIINPSLDSPLITNEIFGPILPVLPFDTLDSIPSQLLESNHGLVNYLFSHDENEIEFMVRNTQTGALCINDILTHYFQYNLPFGGNGESGTGRGHGFFGYKAFSNERSVVKHHRFNPVKLLFPPYTESVTHLIRFVATYL